MESHSCAAQAGEAIARGGVGIENATDATVPTKAEADEAAKPPPPTSIGDMPCHTTGLHTGDGPPASGGGVMGSKGVPPRVGVKMPEVDWPGVNVTACIVLGAQLANIGEGLVK